MRFHCQVVVSLAGVTLASAALAGVFRKDQDVRSIKGFGAITVVDGRPVIGKEGTSNAVPAQTKFKLSRDATGVYVPLGTQFRLDKGPYLTYELDGETPAVLVASEVNLKAPWQFDVSVTGHIPVSGGPNGRFTQTTEFRVQAMAGKRVLWYLGVDRAAIKAHEEKTRDSGGKDDPPPVWPLILVKDPGDALVFVHRVSGLYQGAK